MRDSSRDFRRVEGKSKYLYNSRKLNARAAPLKIFAQWALNSLTINFNEMAEKTEKKKYVNFCLPKNEVEKAKRDETEKYNKFKPFRIFQNMFKWM